MKKIYTNLTVVLVSLLTINFNYAQEFEWGVNFGSAAEFDLDDIGKAIATDAAGNVYTYGHVDGSTDFDPGSGTSNMSGSGIFVQKLNNQGSFVWAAKFPGSNQQGGMAVADNGDVYITGTFSGTQDFDPGSGTFNLTAEGASDPFVVKLNALGDFQWGVKAGGSGEDFGWGIDVDAAGNAYGVGTKANQVYVFKVTNAGSLDWEDDFGSGLGTGVAVNSSGDVFATGLFGGANTKAFLLKLDPTDGSQVFSKEYVATLVDSRGYSIDFGSDGSIYLGGIYRGGALDFDLGPGTNILTSNTGATYDSFITKLDNAGAHVWAVSFGASSNDYVYSLSVDPDDNVYSTGLFSGTVNFDPEGSDGEVSAGGNGAVFVLKLNKDGDYLWTQSYGNQGWNIGHSVFADGDGNVYNTGIYYGTFDFNAGSGVNELVTTGGYDIFITKQSACTESISTQPVDASVVQGSTAQFTVSWSGTGATFQWQEYDGSGYQDLVDGGDVSGATTATLNLANTTLAQNQFKYRCRVFEEFCGGISDEATLSVSTGSGINEADAIGLTVFPNPASSNITLQAKTPLKQAWITDLNGKRLLELQYNGSLWQADIGTLAKGVYLIDGLTEGESQGVRRLVKL